jgi:hypothetical protein
MAYVSIFKAMPKTADLVPKPVPLITFAAQAYAAMSKAIPKIVANAKTNVHPTSSAFRGSVVRQA